MGISVKYDGEILDSLEIDGENYFCEEDNRVTLQKLSLKGKNIEDIPCGLTIELCDSFDGNIIVLSSAPTSVTRINDNQVKIVFDETTTRKYWDAPIGLKLWMETKRDIISERNINVGDVTLENYDDDGAWISLIYSSTTDVFSFEELFLYIDTLYGEIEGATDIYLGSPFEKIENCQKENDFTVKVLLPLFRNMGFANVKYNHGSKEYGKDITFARRTEFDEYEYYGVQVKFGDVSGGAAGEVDALIAQAKDAFSMPFYDVYSRKQVRLSKVVIAISGKFTSNAIEKIVEGITDHPMKNNLIFLDGDKIRTFMERYRRFNL